MEQDTPTWLKIMENGTVGEARAKAFLIDRFWILERSVDIDGADFIIQRKVTKHNLLDRDAPKLGVVQVKFFSSVNTTHNIPTGYIFDNENNPRADFFLLCHTGSDDDLETFFLTAKDISDNFDIHKKNNIDKYSLPGRQILNHNSFKVISIKNTLDRIENQLKLADFIKNRKFISWSLPSVNIDTTAITQEFNEPLPNWWGEIPEEFKRLKETCQTAIIDIEEAHNNFKRIIEETDPLEALNTLEDLTSDYRNNYGKWSISLPNDLYNPEFHEVCLNHKEKVSFLKEKGLLDNFIKLKNVLKERISQFVCENQPIDKNTILSVTINFSLSYSIINSMDFKLVRADIYFSIPNELTEFGNIKLNTNQYNGIKKLNDQEFEFYWLVGRYHIPEKYKNMCEYFKQTYFREYTNCMDYIYENLPD